MDAFQTAFASGIRRAKDSFQHEATVAVKVITRLDLAALDGQEVSVDEVISSAVGPPAPSSTRSERRHCHCWVGGISRRARRGSPQDGRCLCQRASANAVTVTRERSHQALYRRVCRVFRFLCAGMWFLRVSVNRRAPSRGLSGGTGRQDASERLLGQDEEARGDSRPHVRRSRHAVQERKLAEDVS